MTNAAEDYDDFLEEGGHRWRKRLILLDGRRGSCHRRLCRSSGRRCCATAAQRPLRTQTAKVTLGTIMKSISTSATAASQSTANLSFGQSGNVTAVNVKVGQAVKQGDVLAHVESQTLQDAVTRAQVNLNSAQTKLNTMLKGSTAADLASADQAVIQAQSNLDKANTALQDLYNPTSDTVNAAQQAVLSAQSQLTKAQQARAAVDTNWSDAVSAAQAAVDKAKSAASDASDALDLAETNLHGGREYRTKPATAGLHGIAGHAAIVQRRQRFVRRGRRRHGGHAAPTRRRCSRRTALTRARRPLRTTPTTPSRPRRTTSASLAAAPTATTYPWRMRTSSRRNSALQSANDKLARSSNPSADDVSQAQQAVDSATGRADRRPVQARHHVSGLHAGRYPVAAGPDHAGADLAQRGEEEPAERADHRAVRRHGRGAEHQRRRHGGRRRQSSSASSSYVRGDRPQHAERARPEREHRRVGPAQRQGRPDGHGNVRRDHGDASSPSSSIQSERTRRRRRA